MSVFFHFSELINEIKICLACLLACGSRSISTTTLYCWSVSFAVYDGCEDDCGDRSLKHRFCHIVDMQARLEKLHVYELGDRWLLAQWLLRDFSVQQHT